MSGSEFPLTLLLQVQNDMSSGIQTATQDVEGLKTAVDNAGTSTDTLQSKVQNSRGSFVSLGLGIAAAASGILNLIRQYHNLQKAQGAVENMQRREENATLTLKNAKDKLKDAIREHGKNSKEAEKAQRAVTKAENNAVSAKVRLKNAQVSLNDRMMDFAFSIGPSIVGVVAGLAQTFDILGNRVGGRTGTSGLVGMLTKFIGPLALIGGTALAIKFNLFGFRDALDSVGFSIGQAIPQAVPFLDALRNLGIVLGLVPGDAQEAQDALKKFGGGIIEWGKQVFGTVQEIFKKLTSGDIIGAIDILKESFNKALPGVTQKIQEFFKDPIKTLVNIAVAIDKWVLEQKIGGFSIDQWLTGIGTIWSDEFAKKGPVPTIIDILVVIGQPFIGPLNADILSRIGGLFETEFQQNPIQAGINLLTRIVDFTIVSLLPADLAKLYLKFAQEFDRTKGQNVAKLIIDAAITVNKFIETNIDAPLQAWVKATFTLAKFNAAINTIGTILGKVGTMITNFIFAGLTSFSVAQLDPFLASLTKLETWTSAFESFKTQLGAIGAALFGAIFSSDNTAAVSTVVTNLATTLKDTDWSAVGTGILTGIGDWFNTNLPQTTTAFMGLVEGAIEAAKTAPAAIGAWILAKASDAADSLMKFGGALWASILSGIQTAAQPFLSDPLGTLKKGLESLLNPQGEKKDKNGKVIKTGFNQNGEEEGGMFDSMVQEAVVAAGNIALAFQQATATITGYFAGLSIAVSVIFNSFGANALSGAQQIITAMSTVFTTVSAGMTGLANTWSAICNSFGANAQSGASQIISAFKEVQSALTAAFKAITSAANAAFKAIVAGAKSAVSAMKSAVSAANSLVSALNKVAAAAKKAAAAQAKVGMAKGGILSFASGGVMSAATGKMFTANGAQQIVVGDNPGGRETVAFIPHNDPNPTLERLRRMFGNFMSDSGPSVSSSVSGSSGGAGGIVVQVFLDGKQIKGEVVSMLARNQSAMK